MKKSFLLRIQLSLAVVGLAAFTIAFPTTTNAQERKIVCEGKDRGSVWAATCCKCKDNCVLIDAKPRMPGDCRHCNLLCVECREAMGDLNQELEKLKQKNRALYQAYQKIEDDLNESNKKFYDAATRITGMKDDPENWNLNGLTGSFGNFSVSLISFASNFTGHGAASRIVKNKWFGTGVTIFSNGIGIYQTASGKSDYSSAVGIADEAASWTGIMSDFTTTDFWNWLYETLKAIDEKKMIHDINEGAPLVESFLKHKSWDIPPPPRLTPEVIKQMELFSVLTDIWALGRSFYTLVNDLTDLLSSYYLASDAEKELQKIQDDILKNNTLMACIRETQDFLNKGGPKVIRKGNKASWGMAVSLITPAIISYNHNSLRFFSKNDFFKSKFRVDEIKLKSAISRLKQLINAEKLNETIFAKKIFPTFFPWITGKWKSREPAVLIQLLKNGKAGFQELIKNYEKMIPVYESIKNELRYAVIFEKEISDGTSSAGMSPLSEYTEGFYLIENEPGNSVTEKWSLAANKKIVAGKGRVNLKFPANVQWSVDIYTGEDKFFTNRSSYSKHGSYDLVPGNYKFILNSVPVGNASVENGKETVFKVGIFNMMSRGSWELYDGSKKTYYTSRNIPVKIALPVGNYILSFEKKDYKITIRNGMTLKFDFRKPLFVDQ